MFDILLKILKFYQSIAELMFDKISEFNINNQKIPQLCFKILFLEKIWLYVIEYTYIILSRFA